MRLRALVGILFAGAVACGGSGGRPGVVEREVGTGAQTSLPAARVAYGALAMDQGPPISLTASDGTGLELTRLEAKAVVDGPLAFTELHLTFKNPRDRVVEGRFAITLPESAAISRFAMKLEGRWQEAEMVERAAALRAYEDFLHRRQDPALLEKEAGNEFRARVFPIPANGEKELIVAYSQELADPDQPYVLPLAGLPRIHDVSARVQVARADGAAIRWDELKLDQRDWQPDRDLAAPASAATHALRAGHVVAMRIAPELSAAPETIARATILVDTSASRALGFPAYAKEVDALVAELGRAHPGLDVVVAAFDQGVEELYAGKAKDAAGKLDATLRGRMPLGASDLGAALRWAKQRGAEGRLVVIGDGVTTAGDAALGDQVDALASTTQRVDVVLAGGIRDRAAAEALARGHRARDGAVLSLDDGAGEVARRLALETRSGIAVAVEGAEAVWPARLDGVQPGDAAMVYAWFAGDAPRTVNVSLGGDRRRVDAEASLAPLVTRAAAQAEIARLEGLATAEPDLKKRGALVDRIVKVSTAERVMSDHTALLVLESEADYQRFGIDRKALAGILVVGEHGVEVQQRTDVALLATDHAAQPVRHDADKKKNAEKKPAFSADDNGEENPFVVDGLNARQELADEDGAEGGFADGADDGLDDAKPMAEPPEEGESAPHGRGQLGRAPAPATETEEQTLEVSGAAGGVGMGAAVSSAPPVPPRDARSGIDARRRAPSAPEPEAAGPPPYTGRMQTVMDLIAAKKLDDALGEALRWRGEDPGDVMALIGLGEAFEASGRTALAGRAYGSVIDLFPARADLRRFAGERLDRLAAHDAGARDLAIDAYRKAVEQRPDHLTGHRLLAMALLRAGKTADAFAALEHGLAQRYPSDRFLGGVRILKEDLGLVGAAWLHQEPTRKAEILRRLRAAGASLEDGRSLRFVLTWETDANDVDFHIRDARGGHAYYQDKRLASGGALYEDVTTGYGPECFTIRGTPKAAPYQLSIHYYSRGPMGYGMGKLEIVRHDGKGTLSFEERPFVVMNDEAFVELGTVK